MRIRKIYLRNFKNHRNVDIVLKPGINVICGESNSGKSNAIIVSYSWLFDDNATTPLHLIGPYATYCYVCYELEDNQGVIYYIEKYSEHESRKNVYIINGTKYYPSHNKIPPEVKRLDPIKSITVNGNNYTPQLRKQHDPYFMLESNQVDRISLCFWGTDILLLESMKKDTQKEADAFAKQIEAKQARVSEINTKIDEMAYVNEWRNILSVVKIKNGQIKAIDTKLTTLADSVEEMTNLDSKIAEIDALPSVLEIENKISKLTELDSLITKLEDSRTINNTLKQLDSVPLPEYYDRAVLGLTNYSWVLHYLREAKIVSEGIESTRKTIEIAVPVGRYINEQQAIASALEIIKDLAQTEADIRTANDSIKLLDEEIHDLEHALEGVDTCPTCQQPVEGW